ncbi:MAG: B12-binding domain-containing radical SAM protein [Deltaproteobacteria bacterium]|nr:B12-binding domain-containing radical SAM protein [Deltaproteobacteria bacterium]
MRVALCSMPEVSPWIRGEGWHVPNLALCNIAGNTPGHDVVVFDLNRRRRGLKRAVDRILDRFEPQLLGLSAMTFQYDTARSIAWLAKQRNPQIVTVLGGYHASMLHREIAASWDHTIIDWIVRGEGDRTVAEIIEVIQGRRDPTQVLGASFRDGDDYHHNDDRPLQDLAALELPARHKRAYIGAHLGPWPADVIETSRGCTLACNFCSINTMYGKSHRFFPTDHVLQDIEQLSRRFAKEVFWADDNSTNDLPRLEALCDEMIAQRPKLRCKLRITTQATSAGIAQSQGLVDKLAKAGVAKVFLGIENSSSKTLKEMKKGDIVELTKTAVRRLHQAGIICVGGCIVGFPDDDVETIRRNFEFFRSLGVELVIPQIITPYPGTGAREIALRGGYVTNEDDLRWYNGYWANVRTKHLSSRELEFWRWKLAREVIGPFRATEVYQRHYPVTARAWNLALMPAYKLFDRTLTRVLGERRRYERAMDDFRRMDQFDLEPPPVPFRIKTQPLRQRSFSMRGLQRSAT